jgi:hypothetical protein
VSEEMESVRRRLQEELSQALKERNVAKEDALKIYKVLGKGSDLNGSCGLGLSRCEVRDDCVQEGGQALYC